MPRIVTMAFVLTLALLAATPGMTAQAEWPAYRGNVKSRIYHNSGCKYFNCKACTVPLASPQEARTKGFRPAKSAADSLRGLTPRSARDTLVQRWSL